MSNTIIEPTNKICRRCELELPVARFHRNKKNADGYHNICIECRHKTALGIFEGRIPRGPSPKPTSELFWGKVDKTKSCWVWKGTVRRRDGSPLFSFGSPATTVSASRWAFEDQFGFAVPDHVHLFRLCGNRLCVKPGHLTARAQLLKA